MWKEEFFAFFKILVQYLSARIEYTQEDFKNNQSPDTGPNLETFEYEGIATTPSCLSSGLFVLKQRI
jgi:hypothetical protein